MNIEGRAPGSAGGREERRTPRWLRFRWPSRIVWTVLGCSLAGTALGFALFLLALEREAGLILREHQRLAQTQIAAIESQVEASLHFALALKALIQHDPNVDRKVFRRFYEELLQDSKHARSLRLIEWLRQVPAKELDQFERQQRLLRADPSYRVWQPGTAGGRKPASGRPYYHVVQWIEPVEEHGAMAGLDSGHTSATQMAIWRARKSGRLAATAGFKLAQDPPGQTSVIVYAPVYRRAGGGPDDVLGLAAIGIGVQPLLEGAMLPAARAGFEVRIYDEGIHGDERVPLAGRTVGGGPGGSWRTLRAPAVERTIHLADRRWHVVCSGTYALPFSRTWPAWLLLAASLLITAAVQFFILHLHRQNVLVRREVRRRTRQLRRALRLAKEGTEAKSRFLAKISHEIRTPLNGIIGMTHLLMESGLSREQRESAALILNSGQHLLAVVNDTLDLSKIEAGKLALAREPLDLNALLGECERIFRPVAEQKGLELSIEDQGLPPWVEGDLTRLRQVLWNLLSNAVKFTAHGRVELAARPGTAPPRIRFEVRDTGPGIPPEDLARLFEPYFQSNAPGRAAEGTGLGLAISRRLVELMGGEMGCESEPGLGSLFWFEVPLPEAAPKTEASQAGPGRTEPLRAHVLLVEDNRVNQIVSSRMLERLGCRVTVASTGEEALTAVRQAEFDAILMDCQMPVMDGYEAARAIRQMGGRAASTPIIALTAHALESEQARCLESGMNAVITKPVTLETLRGALERAISPTAGTPARTALGPDPVLLHSTRSDAAQRQGSP
ncbi:MAG: CHASE domain-containing protein [Bryobacteraceae bacterium]|nr:CHASE domain-containing protein [Bryobacteraceae bacterium]